MIDIDEAYETIATVITDTEALLVDTEAVPATISTLLTDTEALLVDTEAVPDTISTLLTDTETILVDTETVATVITDTEAILVDTEANKVITDALGSAAAGQLKLSANQIITGTVDTVVNTHTPTTTEFQADDITEATADHYNGRIIIFTSGVLAGQATAITDYVLVTTIGQFTVVAMTEAPANNDTFIVL